MKYTQYIAAMLKRKYAFLKSSLEVYIYICVCVPPPTHVSLQMKSLKEFRHCKFSGMFLFYNSLLNCMDEDHSSKEFLALRPKNGNNEQERTCIL
jgi:hypothetical protein